MIVIGLMSGTSADGVDAAVVELGGVPPALACRLMAHIHAEYSSGLRDEIFACFRPETGTVDRLCSLNFALGRAFAGAAIEAARAAGLALEQIDLIGSHGQTLWHIPTGERSSTLQLGEAGVIAELTGVPVVSNFRPRDMAAGGQGAPLVPLVDALLLTHPTRVRAAQNLGGIANVTYLPAGDPAAAFAFDTGPGNALIDAAAGWATGGTQAYDRDGTLAAAGRRHSGLLDEMLAEPYLILPPPKSTGRELFGRQFAQRVWDRGQALGLSGPDIVATLTAFTAASIGRAYRSFLPIMPQEVILSGGGARNPVLIAWIQAELVPARVYTSDELGLPAEAKEALAFAVLAYETWHGRPGNLPRATGASHGVVLGSVTPGTRGRGAPMAVSLPAISVPGLPITETRNPHTERIDTLSTLAMVETINREDARVAAAVAQELPAVAAAIDRISAGMARGGRLIYAGAGTSGRLAVLDAAECPPTFGTPSGVVVALLAGAQSAVTRAVEDAEDDAEGGAAEISALDVGKYDSVVGVAASGSTPYVIGALTEARRRGAFVVSVACNRPSALEALADVAIAPLVGPEVVTGSTRLKAGTSQKMVLNMISTGVMIRLGKTFGNLMVDVQPTNAKLRRRARRIVEQATGVASSEAEELLDAAGGEVKTAIVAALLGTSPTCARERLAAAGGAVRKALQARPEEG